MVDNSTCIVGIEKSIDIGVNKKESHEELLKAIENFKYNKVWFTKKARMEAESRMNNNDKLSSVVINYYNLLVLSVSIYTLAWESKIGVVLTTIVSVGLFGISNYINSLNYKENAFKYRESYLRLSKIETKLHSLSLSENLGNKEAEEFKKIREEYDNILELSYNHSNIDYIVVAMQSDKCSKNYIQNYYWYKIKYNIGITAIFILPIIIGVISIIVGGK
ncbi:SLATT domain-containing protein [uncultured Clostridium sp.]|uniref:SLATT domain-containing protein n=1 Tax=uncultured Clostridium sp. TaxID=59620 RepID=UPI0028E1D24F|nr:SLATT domain-containing protein [uncultured Clostridium sp.]